MSEAQKEAVARHRRKRRRQGLVRVEVQVRHQDAGLLRRVAAALGDPVRGAEARRLLLARFGPADGLKALLEAAPLDDVPLHRSRDTGRDIDL